MLPVTPNPTQMYRVDHECSSSQLLYWTRNGGTLSSHIFVNELTKQFLFSQLSVMKAIYSEHGGNDSTRVPNPSPAALCSVIGCASGT